MYESECVWSVSPSAACLLGGWDLGQEWAVKLLIHTFVAFMVLLKQLLECNNYRYRGAIFFVCIDTKSKIGNRNHYFYTKSDSYPKYFQVGCELVKVHGKVLAGPGFKYFFIFESFEGESRPLRLPPVPATVLHKMFKYMRWQLTVSVTKIFKIFLK